MAKTKTAKNGDPVRVTLHGLSVDFEVQRLKSGSVSVLIEADGGTTFRAVIAPSEARMISEALYEASEEQD